MRTKNNFLTCISFRTTYGSIKNSLMFKVSEGGYANEFYKYKTNFNLRYEAIRTIVYKYLEVNDLKYMKINDNNNFQWTDDRYFTFYSNCMSEIYKTKN